MLTRKDLEKLEIGKDVLIDNLDAERIFYGIAPNDRVFTYREYNRHSAAYHFKEWQHWTIKKKTKKVKLLAFINVYGYLGYLSDTEEFDEDWQRVPSEDKEVEVEE